MKTTQQLRTLAAKLEATMERDGYCWGGGKSATQLVDELEARTAKAVAAELARFDERIEDQFGELRNEDTPRTHKALAALKAAL